MMIQAEQGTAAMACVSGQVVAIYEALDFFEHRPASYGFNMINYGLAVTIDLGNGYEVTYGQLEDIQVTEGSYVEAGQVIGYVAEPTNYFELEGSHLYLELRLDGAFVNPEILWQ